MTPPPVSRRVVVQLGLAMAHGTEWGVRAEEPDDDKMRTSDAFGCVSNKGRIVLVCWDRFKKTTNPKAAFIATYYEFEIAEAMDDFRVIHRFREVFWRILERTRSG